LILKGKVYIMQSCVGSSDMWHPDLANESAARSIKLHTTEMLMARWMCGFILIERKKNAELRELLQL